MLLRNLQVLGHLSRADRSSGEQIVRVARAIPNLLDDKEIDKLENEWILYSVEVIDRLWFIKDEYVDSNGNNHIKYHPIDDYWNKIFSILTNNGVPKYPTLAKLVKNVLIISHGNADVERCFSINSNIITENRSSLSESSINALRVVYDGVKFFVSGSAHKVAVTSEMINAVKRSSSNYREELMAAKLVKQKDLDNQLKEAQFLIEEGTNRLECALKSSSLVEVQAAKLLLVGGREKLTFVNEQQKQVTNDLEKLRLKRKDAFLHEQSANKKLKSMQ